MKTPSTALLWRWRLEGAAIALAAYTLLFVPFCLVQNARSTLMAWPGEWKATVAAWDGLSRRFTPWSMMAAITPPPFMPTAAESAVVGVPSEEIPDRLHAIGESFLELATRAEGFSPQAYHDAAGWNIGFGYCITRRVGRDSTEAREELAAAWVSPADIDALILGPAARRQQVVLTPFQGIRLLEVVGAKARAAARATMGASFDALPPHRQAVLTWLAYNAGSTGFSKFRTLHDAVRRNDTLVAVASLMPWYRTRTGRLAPNRRAGALLQAAYTAPPVAAADVGVVAASRVLAPR